MYPFSREKFSYNSDVLGVNEVKILMNWHVVLLIYSVECATSVPMLKEESYNLSYLCDEL